MTDRHEKTDMDPRWVLYFAITLVIAAVLIHAGLWWMFHRFEEEQARREARPILVDVPVANPGPQLQINPQADLQDLRRQEDQILSTYGWIDRDKGLVRIPIDRAMQLFIERQKK
jgi:hypothetical protein